MDGQIGNEKLGDIKTRATINIPYGWLECNGQSILRSDYSDLFNMFNTQTYDSEPTHTLLSRYGYEDDDHFNLPDYSEVALVGRGQNISDASLITTHDTYTLGEYHDDCFQTHTHDQAYFYNGYWSNAGYTFFSNGGAAAGILLHLLTEEIVA